MRCLAGTSRSDSEAASENSSHELQELKRRLGVTDGNLASHIQTLETASYIVLEKRGAGRASVTRISLTYAGREALIRYLDIMERLAHEVRAGS